MGFLPWEFGRRKGVSKVVGLEDGWEREEGSSALLRSALQLDLDVDEVCSVLVSLQLTGGTMVQRCAVNHPFLCVRICRAERQNSLVE